MAKTMSEAPEQGLAVDELIELLRDRARDHGGDKLLEAAAAALEAAREGAADAEGALRVAVLALAHASECNPVYMPAYIHVSAAIDQARGLPLDAGEGVSE